jgi:hypothetical protein
MEACTVYCTSSSVPVPGGTIELAAIVHVFQIPVVASQAYSSMAECFWEAKYPECDPDINFPTKHAAVPSPQKFPIYESQLFYETNCAYDLNI